MGEKHGLVLGDVIVLDYECIGFTLDSFARPYVYLFITPVIQSFIVSFSK